MAAGSGTGRRGAASRAGARGGTAAGGSTGSAAESGTVGVTTEAQPAWVTAIVDVLTQAGGSFDPDNARAVVQVMDHFPTVLEAMATFSKGIADKSVESVDLPPSAQEFFGELGRIQAAAVEPTRDALSQAKRTVLDRIARYQGGRSQDAAWDVRANQ